MRLCMLALSVAVLSTAAVASDLPKEGKATGTYNAVGTYKMITAGKDMATSTFDETGLSLASGFTDRTTWRCFGINRGVNGEITGHGNCVGTDPSGDQIFLDFASKPWRMDATTINGTGTYVGGTGKYEGLTGSYTISARSPEFKLPDQSTYVVTATYEATYKLK